MRLLTASWMRLATGQRYLRFGRLPASGRSRCHATGDLEFGISVYDLDEKGQPKDPDPWGETESGNTFGDMQDRIRAWRNGDIPAYIVTGEEAGVGFDGEPILSDVVILGEWNPREPDFIEKNP